MHSQLCARTHIHMHTDAHANKQYLRNNFVYKLNVRIKLCLGYSAVKCASDVVAYD